MVMHKKSFNVDVDEKVSNEFSAQVEQRGYIKYRAIEGALRAFMGISAEEQIALMAVGFPPQNTHQTQAGPKTLREALRNIIESTKENGRPPGVMIQISKSDEKLWGELKRLLGPELKKRKTKSV